MRRGGDEQDEPLNKALHHAALPMARTPHFLLTDAAKDALRRGRDPKETLGGEALI